ncbi:MAG: D-alanyl-D-alanine carboxypeptidase/D-alanyl-D-alanine-endopeptidase, partial [Actinocatenispora sp.]
MQAPPATPPRAARPPVIASYPVGQQIGPPPNTLPPQPLASPAPIPAVPVAPVVPKPRRSRAALVAVIAGVLGLILVAGTLVVVYRPGPVGRLFAEAVQPSPSPPKPPEPAPVLDSLGNAPVPTGAGLAQRLGPILKHTGTGGHVAASVVDVATKESLYGATPDAGEMPASVTKLATAAAVLNARGPTYRMTTRVVAGDAPGEVVLVGGGDTVLALDGHGPYPDAARLDTLADQVKHALHGAKPTKVLVDSSLYSGQRIGPGWDGDIISGGDAAPMAPVMLSAGRVDPTTEQSGRSSEPDLDAGRHLARMLGIPGKDVARGTAGKKAKKLGAVKSAPLVEVVEQMLQRSDDVVAEAMARQVALARGKPGSYAGGAEATIAELKGLGLDTSGLRLSDGSGLSRRNRISPEFLTSLLTLVSSGRHPRLWPVLTGMPVAGYTGTLDSRYLVGPTAEGAGMIHAKTGSLSTVSTLAGLVVDRDGRLLAFALMAGHIPVTYDINTTLDQAAAALAGCGCR